MLLIVPTIRDLKAAEAQNPGADDIADPVATAVKGYRERFSTLGLAEGYARRFSTLGLAGVDPKRFSTLALAGVDPKRFSTLGLAGLAEGYATRFSTLGLAEGYAKRFSTLALAGIDAKRFTDLIASVQASTGALHEEAAATGGSVDWLLLGQITLRTLFAAFMLILIVAVWEEQKDTEPASALLELIGAIWLWNEIDRAIWQALS